MTKIWRPLLGGVVLGYLFFWLVLPEGSPYLNSTANVWSGQAEASRPRPRPRVKDPDGPEKIMLVDPKGKKTGTLFPHHKHSKRRGKNKIECEFCHHRLKSKDPLFRKLYRQNNRQCTHCHLRKKRKKQVSRKIAFHRQCIRCHRKERKKGNKIVPTKCKQCHPRKKPPPRR